MSSGYGWTGGRSRCFPYWQEFAKCYASADSTSECRLPAADYLECLHHTEEIKRAKAIKSHYVQKALHENREGRKAADIMSEGVIVGVGLIGQENGDNGKPKS